eukprot:scaffold10570_cov141-Skeletonema_menzelii.AAC.4
MRINQSSFSPLPFKSPQMTKWWANESVFIALSFLLNCPGGGMTLPRLQSSSSLSPRRKRRGGPFIVHGRGGRGLPLPLPSSHESPALGDKGSFFCLWRCKLEKKINKNKKFCRGLMSRLIHRYQTLMVLLVLVLIFIVATRLETPQPQPAIQTKNVAIHIMGGSGLCSQLMMLLVIQLYYEKGCHRKFMVDESFFGGYRRSSSEGILTGFFTPQMPVLDELKDRSIFAKKWLPVSAQTGDPFISYGPPISSSSPNSIEDATGSETPLVISGVFSHNGHFRRGLQKLDKTMKKTDDNLHSQWDWHYLYYSLIPYACNNFQFNQRTQKEIKEHLLEHNISTSPSTNRKMVGFHIRRSDKVVSGESSKYTAQAYVKKWINSLGEMRNTTAQSFTHCFIASDEFVAVEEFRAALDHEKIPCHVITLTPTARNGTSDAKQRKSTYAETLTFLAEMSVLVEAEYFVGTMGSNVGAFVTLMRSCPAYFRGESLEDYKEKLTKNHYYNSFGVDRDWYTRGMD